MKKKKLASLLSLLVVGSLIFSGCGETESKSASGESGEAYTIGISQLVEHPALDEARRGFIDGLKELGVEVEIDYQNAAGEIPNTVSIAEKFKKDEVDLIYTIATPAAQSAKQVTSDIPILFSAVTDPVEAEIVDDWNDVGANVTGTSDKAPIKSQLKMFKEIDENIKTIGILYNTSEANSEVQIKEVKKLAPNEDLEVIAVGVSNVNEIPQAIDSLLKKVDAVYTPSDNLIASSIELIASKLIDKTIISVSAESAHVESGTLITNGLSYYELGKQTAAMAKEILVDKKSPSDIPVGLASETVTTINVNTLEKLGLDKGLDIFKDAKEKGK